MVGSFFAQAPSKNKNGDDIYCGVSEGPITAYQVVALIDGEIVQADKDTVAHCNRIVGIATNSVTAAGEEIKIQATGEVTNLAWSFTPGERLFLGSNGGILTSITATDSIMVPIGHAIDSNTILIDIKPSIRRTN